MTREEFKKLYDLLELANPGEYEYNGEDTISNEVRRGIWVSIINLEDLRVRTHGATAMICEMQTVSFGSVMFWTCKGRDWK